MYAGSCKKPITKQRQGCVWCGVVERQLSPGKQPHGREKRIIEREGIWNGYGMGRGYAAKRQTRVRQ